MLAITGWLRVGLIAGAIAAVIGAYAYWRHEVYSEGYKAAIADVAARNKGALTNVRKATKSVEDCYDAGGVWDTSVGLCHDR